MSRELIGDGGSAVGSRVDLLARVLVYYRDRAGGAGAGGGEDRLAGAAAAGAASAGVFRVVTVHAASISPFVDFYRR